VTEHAVFYRLVKIAASILVLKDNLKSNQVMKNRSVKLRNAVGTGREKPLRAKTARAAGTRRKTRIQKENENRILEASLDIFASNGFRGSTIDQIAEAAGMSKPNLLYYFPAKEAIHRKLIEHLLENWLDPLREMNPHGDPINEIRSYIRRKIEMARDFPRESRLFANEILQGAPYIEDVLREELKPLVDEKAEVIRSWTRQGKLNRCDPYHLIFSIWATTQHYADFDAQVCAVLGPDVAGPGRFDDAARFLDLLYVEGLRPQAHHEPEAGLHPE
jgi:TetR/AcrR family transcriptional regulator